MRRAGFVTSWSLLTDHAKEEGTPTRERPTTWSIRAGNHARRAPATSTLPLPLNPPTELLPHPPTDLHRNPPTDQHLNPPTNLLRNPPTRPYHRRPTRPYHRRPTRPCHRQRHHRR